MPTVTEYASLSPHAARAVSRRTIGQVLRHAWRRVAVGVLTLAMISIVLVFGAAATMDPGQEPAQVTPAA